MACLAVLTDSWVSLVLRLTGRWVASLIKDITKSLVDLGSFANRLFWKEDLWLVQGSLFKYHWSKEARCVLSQSRVLVC